ncbi:MAG: hypothetical protein IAE81_23155 [Caldilineaceae bacterium]|jgi:hypothetical protein|nr:hypothetical protein [Caldilineaceae bacterium]
MMTQTLLGAPLVFWGMLCLAIAVAYYYIWPRPDPRRLAPRTTREHIVLRYFHSLVWVLLAAGCFLAAASLGDLGRWIALLGIPVYIIFLVYVVRDRRKEDAARAAQRQGAGARNAGAPQ